MKIIKIKDIKNWQYYIVGAFVLILLFIIHKVIGYKMPRPFSMNQINRAIDYDFRVVDVWIKYYSKYSKNENTLKDMVVLELGPGPDLGVGIILLAMGVKKYVALDVNELATSVPIEFYNQLFNNLKQKYPECDVQYLREQLNKCYMGEDSALNYIVDNKFSISKIDNKFDIVFSQASFEHFKDVRKTIQELNSVVNENCILVTEIDLRTHTPWIRDRDPLNIYRYKNSFWNLFKFDGIPNRIRAFEYKEILEENGCIGIEIEPLTILEKEYVEKIKLSLNKKFRELDFSEMRMLSVMLMAEKNNKNIKEN